MIDRIGHDAESTLWNHPKTECKWRYRDTIEDTLLRPTAPLFSSLTPLEKADAVTFRQKMLLPFDNYLHALQREILSVIQSSLPRLYQLARNWPTAKG